MKSAGALLVCLGFLLIHSGCKKEEERRLVNSLVGTYKLSGFSFYYSPIPPYYSDSTLITDTLISITKYDDTSLSVGGLQCQYCPQCPDPKYCFMDEQPESWFVALIFYASNTDSVNFNFTWSLNPVSGKSIVLSGRKIP